MKIEVYTKDDCIFCTKAKNLLKEVDLEYKEFNINKNISRGEIIKKFPTMKTFPIVVIDDKLIGGYTELATCLENR